MSARLLAAGSSAFQHFSFLAQREAEMLRSEAFKRGRSVLRSVAGR
jgi:hypothetical protein